MSKSVLMTGVSIANSMVGSSMILLPLKFNQYGIGINLIFMVFMAAVMALTCKLLIDHLLPHELDIAVSIRRKLGPGFGTAFGVMSSATLFLVSSVFFLLAGDILYDVVGELFGTVVISEKIFKLILMVVFALLSLLKDLKWVFKLSPLAMAALIASTLTLIASIPFNIDNITPAFLDWHPLSLTDLLAVASLNGFAFICHLSISPMIKENSEQGRNWVAVCVGFGLTTGLYVMVGVLGALAIFGRERGRGRESVMGYFEGGFQAPLIGGLTFLYLFLISPIFPYVSKNQALELLGGREGGRLWGRASGVYAGVWMAMNAGFVVFETSPVVVISFITTVMAFYITYFLPVYMSLKVGDYRGGKKSQEILRGEETEVDGEKLQSLLTDGVRVSEKSLPLWKKALYLSILGYGIFIMICELIWLFA